MGRHLKGGRSFDVLSKYGWFVPDGRGIIVLLVMFLIGSLLSAVAGAFLMKIFGDVFFNAYGQLIIYPITFIPAMIYASNKAAMNAFNPGKAIDSSNWKPLGGLTVAVLMVVVTILMSIAIDPVSVLLPPMPDFLEEALRNMTSESPLWASLLCVGVFAQIFEEWLCRGMVLRGLLSRVRPIWAIVISALFFGLIHMNPWQALPAFLIGCLMGYVYYRTGSLKLTMLIHCVNNTFSVFVSRIDSIAEAQTYYEVIPDHRMYWLAVISALLLVALAVKALRRIELKSSQGNIDDLPPMGV